ncbi:hypothetical protein CDV31_000794 [Fusarium ambrosium]|uniref:Uncharacterized protein n=1 Tax=Fusarium ambrosium TaxID=131363 RepID=A0A428V197_9HYPO|nr:hypothetical protein CDV31_000794 [Fusarium ambrosium]
MMAQTGMELDNRAWERFIKPGLHIEQAMVVSRASSLEANCVDPRCGGKVVQQATQLDLHRKQCTSCGRWTTTRTTTASLLELYVSEAQDPITSQTRATRRSHIGPQLPPMQFEEQPEAFRRVKFYQASQPIEDFDDVLYRLDNDAGDPAANAFFGFICLKDGDKRGDADMIRRSKQHLEITVTSDPLNFENWYLLGRACILLRDFKEAYDALLHAVFHEGQCAPVWNTIGVLYFQLHQYSDSLDSFERVIRLSPRLYEPWYNLGVLYDHFNQTEEAINVFQRCIELNPELPKVHARLRVLRSQISASNSQRSSDDFIHEMCESELRMRYDGISETEGDNIVINPIRETGILEEDDYSDDDDTEYEEDGHEDIDYENSGGEGDDSRIWLVGSSISESMA